MYLEDIYLLINLLAIGLNMQIKWLNTNDGIGTTVFDGYPIPYNFE